MRANAHYATKTWLSLWAVATVPAWAQPAPASGTLAYAPVSAQAIPTMTEWGLIGMAVVLVLLAMKTLRSQGANRLGAWAAGLLGGIVAISGFSAAKSYALVLQPSVLSMTQTTGGLLTIPECLVATSLQKALPTCFYEVKNTTNVAQQVTQISLNPGFALETPPAQPQCAVGSFVQPGASCYVAVRPPIG